MSKCLDQAHMSTCLDHCDTIYIMLILNKNIMLKPRLVKLQILPLSHRFCPSCTTPVVTQTSHVVTINTVSTISYTGLTTFDTKPSYNTFCAHAHTHTKKKKTDKTSKNRVALC